MKTSKIIIISLLGTITLIIVAAAINIRVNGLKSSDSDVEFNVKALKVDKERVPVFKQLVLNNSRNVTLVQDDSTYLEIHFPKDSIAPDINYKTIGDTLKISDMKILMGYSEIKNTTKRDISVKIHFNSSLKKVLLKNSNLNMGILNVGNLALDIDQSTVWFNDEMGSSKKTIIQSLDIVAKNHSIVSANNIKVDSLGLSLQNSEASLEANGTMSESIRIAIKRLKENSTKRDTGYKINLGN